MTITEDYCRWLYLTSALPSGVSSSALVALYRFDGPTAGLTDRSGGGHNLTSRATYDDCWSMLERSHGLGGLEHRGGYWAHGPTSLTPGTTGAFTVEFIWTPTAYSASVDRIITIGDTTLTTEADNLTVCVVVKATTGEYGIFHERDLGVDEGPTYFAWSGVLNCTQHVAVTRASDGVTYKLYLNGVYVDSLTASNAPTGGGGANVNIKIGGDATGNEIYGHLHSLRYATAEFSADQVADSHAACRLDPCMDIFITGVSPDPITTAGGELLTVTGHFDLSKTYRAYLGPSGDSTDTPCFFGFGSGYVGGALDVETLAVVAPPVSKGVNLLTIEEVGGNTATSPAISVMERNWPQSLFEMRRNFAPWKALGARRLELEDME